MHANTSLSGPVCDGHVTDRDASRGGFAASISSRAASAEGGAARSVSAQPARNQIELPACLLTSSSTLDDHVTCCLLAVKGHAPDVWNTVCCQDYDHILNPFLHVGTEGHDASPGSSCLADSAPRAQGPGSASDDLNVHAGGPELSTWAGVEESRARNAPPA
eukprot:1873671-Rhodomonas_salina.1